MTGWRTAGPLSPAAQLQMGLWGSDPDGWAWLAEPHNQPLFGAVLDATGTGPGTRLLDLGCGTGLLLTLAQARGATVTGLDVTPGLLQIARDRLPTAELWQADICSLPFGDAEFDVVTGVNAFQFAADPPAAVAAAARVTRPGGLVAVGTFAAPERAESTAVHLAMAALSPPRRQARPRALRAHPGQPGGRAGRGRTGAAGRGRSRVRVAVRQPGRRGARADRLGRRHPGGTGRRPRTRPRRDRGRARTVH